jgi:hypothetical protein
MSTTEAAVRPATPPGAEFLSVEHIRRSRENDEIYGVVDTSDNDLINLVNDIAQNGIREPIRISRDRYIISGHRRYAAARLAGLTEVPVWRMSRSRREYTAIEWKRLLRSYNHQRVKSAAVRLNEAMLDLDPDLAHKQLISEREERDRKAPPRIKVDGEKVRSSFSDRKLPMLQRVLEIVEGLRDYWPVSDRQIHYGLLNNPPLRNASQGCQRSVYQNDGKSYNDLCDMLTRARLLGLIPWEAIADETRPVSGLQYPKDAATFYDIEAYHFLRNYRRDLMQSQPDHIELIVEKLTVQSIIGTIASQYCVPMTVGRGYCSINPRHEIVQRFRKSGKHRLVLLIAADFDPDGEEIAESLVRSIRDDFGVDDVVASKILLRSDQVREWELPHNGMEAKEGSSKFHKFIARHGSNAVFELEAVPPEQMQAAVREAIEATIDVSAFNRELEAEKRDAVRLQSIKQALAESFSGMSGNGR